MRLKNVEGLRVSLNPPGISIKFRGGSRVNIADLLIGLNDIGEPVIIAIDEAQGLRRVNWLRFDRLFAYIFDNLTNLRLVLSGSQIGLLYGFLGLNDPRAPLFGRAYMEIKTRRLSLMNPWTSSSVASANSVLTARGMSWRGLWRLSMV